MAILFDDILSKGIRAGQIPARTQQARDWYRNTAKSYGTVSENQFFKSNDKQRFTTSPQVGSMYMFTYSAKFKNELPYWDQFPLVFPFSTAPGGFMGLNLHYLPLQYRAKLMDSLYGISNNKAYNESTKLNLSYEILNKASKFRYFKPTVKHYLMDHLTSRFIYIYPSEWDVALFLPLERFQKASKQQVWTDSRKIIGN